MSKTKNEWIESTWNPTTECTLLKMDGSCKNCNALTMYKKLKAIEEENYNNVFKVCIHPKELERPYTWKKPRIVYVSELGDLFNEDVPLEFIKQVFKVMNDNSQHSFNIITERAERLFEVYEELIWSPNIWMGIRNANQLIVKF